MSSSQGGSSRRTGACTATCGSAKAILSLLEKTFGIGLLDESTAFSMLEINRYKDKSRADCFVRGVA
jgi:hypothetical protein